MKNKIAFLLILLLFVTGSAFSQTSPKIENGLEWYTRMEKAYELSKKEKKPIFAFFTGSDWCGWCRKLQADVFVKEAFIKWAKENVILLELDFPRGKQLEPELQQQNYSLQQTFRVAGYPTIWLFNLNKADTSKNYSITPYGSLGYPAGAEPGKEEVKFLRTADSLLLPSKPAKSPDKKSNKKKK